MTDWSVGRLTKAGGASSVAGCRSNWGGPCDLGGLKVGWGRGSWLCSMALGGG